MNTDIIKKQTAEEMVNTYQEACRMIDEGYTILYKANKLLVDTFGPYTRHGRLDVFDDKISPRFHPQAEATKGVKDRIARSVWSGIINQLDIQKIASNERWEKIQKDLEKGELPDLTVPAIFDLLMSFQQNARVIQEELVREVFETLRPHRNTYKTNSQYEIGKKVILTWKVENPWGHGFRVMYRSEKEVISIDKVFHMLDGKPFPDSYKSPLVDAINTSSDGFGETEYFKFRACLNYNLHLEFKRPDLVAAFNAIAGGARLRNSKK